MKVNYNKKTGYNTNFALLSFDEYAEILYRMGK